MKANLASPIFNVSFLDYPNPADGSFVISLIGCEHNCPGCQNPELQVPGKVRSTNLDPYELVDLLEKTFGGLMPSNKITLIGGDPLHPNNVAFTKALCHIEGWDICIYTGYDVEYVKKLGVKNFKYLKCGLFDKNRYQEPMKNSHKIVFASKNQVLYDENYKQLSRDGVYAFPEETF